MLLVVALEWEAGLAEGLATTISHFSPANGVALLRREHFLGVFLLQESMPGVLAGGPRLTVVEPRRCGAASTETLN
jgi:hypothetical protein